MSDPSVDPLLLLGLPLAEAQAVLAGLGRTARVAESRPPRPRRPFPEEAGAWRVARVRESAEGELELLVVPPIELTAEGAEPGSQPDPS